MCLKSADILIPQNADMSKWSVIACDQYTSDINYWETLYKTIGTDKSTLKFILPEAYLENLSETELNDKITSINRTMGEYLSSGMFKLYQNALIYVERTLADGKVRRGIIGAIDLEEYDYNRDSTAKIRATEETVVERLPVRIKIRENAPFESPHIILLYDDSENPVIDSVNKNKPAFEKIYDFNLSPKGERIQGYLPDSNSIRDILNALRSTGINSLRFVAGDGNHSLASAKECYEKLKASLPYDEYINHPARYALTEVVSIYDESIKFEPIYRVLFDVDVENVLTAMEQYFDIIQNPTAPGYFDYDIYYGGNHKKITVRHPEDPLPVAPLQEFLDMYIKKHGGRIDYIHDKNNAVDLSSNSGNICFIFDTLRKFELFAHVQKYGVLPRKTFSIGEADDKRYYLECRAII